MKPQPEPPLTPKPTPVPPPPGPLQRREARLALFLMLPTVATVLAVVTLPLLANFWISAKPVTLGDLRAPAAIVRERISGAINGGELQVRYRIRNSSRKTPIHHVVLRDELAGGWRLAENPTCAAAAKRHIVCRLGTLAGGGRMTVNITLRADSDYGADSRSPTESAPTAAGESSPPIADLNFTWDNFRAVFSADEFFGVLKVSLLYAFGGAGGALFLGLLAALLLFHPFRGRALWRGLFLFPYIAPVIAVAFTWVVLFDPFTGAVNALLTRGGALDSPINFFGARALRFDLFGWEWEFPLALTSVIAFEAWRYFPLAFLFILARMQSFNPELGDAAEMDGATPWQKFRHISLPQLAGVLSVMFLLRFIWTFNKFDDIFLLTGGAAGTRTLVVSVYEYAFALSDIGAGAAAAVAVFATLLLFCALFFRLAPKDEGL